MTASVNAHFKFKSLREAAEVVEIPAGVTVRLSEALKEFFRAAHGVVSELLIRRTTF